MVDAAVAEPVEAHVHGFGTFWLDTAVDNAFGSAVVCLDWSRGLLVTQFLEDVLYFNSFACVDVKCSEFCLCGGGHDCFDAFRDS